MARSGPTSGASGGDTEALSDLVDLDVLVIPEAPELFFTSRRPSYEAGLLEGRVVPRSLKFLQKLTRHQEGVFCSELCQGRHIINPQVGANHCFHAQEFLAWLSQGHFRENRGSWTTGHQSTCSVDGWAYSFRTG